jgi:transposase-like protein
MRGILIPQTVKDQIIESFKNGISIKQLATEYNLHPNTIRKWIADTVKSGTSDSTTSKADAYTIARLRREKQELVEMIGKMAIQIEQMNRNFKKNDS